MTNQVATPNTNQNNQQNAVTQPVAPDFMMGLAELKHRADMVSQIKAQIMRKDVHFGIIPGCGSKPTLLKNGAELLCMAFRLASDVKVDITDLGAGHREYTVTTTLTSAGELVATGLGSCSTMESKYRYRGNEAVPTGNPVPKAYWDAKKANDSAEMKRLLGGPNFTAKKDQEGHWMIFQKSDKKMENADIADVYNTVLKMASKRSLIDAVLKATGGSCEFTQDIEDNPQAYGAPASYEPEYTVMDEPPAPPAAQPQQIAPPHHSRGTSYRQELNAMRAVDPQAFERVKVRMQAQGWNVPLDVPENRRQEVRAWFDEEVEKSENQNA